MVEGSYLKARRDELADFLRSRRARVTPEEMGLAPGLRRRTPGLRREEVAQLAGVGVTWYTWLEQGRPINVSVQVLDAVARVLKLGPAERWHLYRLADVPGIPRGVDTRPLPADVPVVLDALEPLPACVYNSKYDVLACNESYAAMFPQLVGASGRERNALWQIFALNNCPLRDTGLVAHMVSRLRAGSARHIGEPEWSRFVDDLCARSAEFAALWASHDVAEPVPQTKSFELDEVGQVDVRTSAYSVDGMGESRMIVYLPATPADAAKIEQLRSAATRARVPVAS